MIASVHLLFKDIYLQIKSDPRIIRTVVFILFSVSSSYMWLKSKMTSGLVLNDFDLNDFTSLVPHLLPFTVKILRFINKMICNVMTVTLTTKWVTCLKKLVTVKVAGRKVAKLHMSSPILIRSNPFFFLSFHVPWPFRSARMEKHTTLERHVHDCFLITYLCYFVHYK